MRLNNKETPLSDQVYEQNWSKVGNFHTMQNSDTLKFLFVRKNAQLSNTPKLMLVSFGLNITLYFSEVFWGGYSRTCVSPVILGVPSMKGCGGYKELICTSCKAQW